MKKKLRVRAVSLHVPNVESVHASKQAKEHEVECETESFAW